MTSNASESSIIEALEVKVAFLEQALSDLSDEYYAQQKELSALKSKLDVLIDKFQREAGQETSQETIVDERPPHY